MMRGGWWLAAAVLVLGTGCGATSVPSRAAGPDDREAGGAQPAGSAEAGPQGGPRATAAAAGAEPVDPSAQAGREPVLAVDSDPPGVEPLSEPETQELAAKCDPLVRHLRQLAERDPHRRTAAEYVETLATDPPKLAGVDVPRCSALLLRSTRAYVAKSLESQAISNLKRILVGLAGAYERDGRLCPSAPPVPADEAAVRDRSYQAKPSDWQAAGWRCAGFDTLRAPQHFQYEIAVDPASKRFEILARGYPVRGQPAVELFLPGRVEDGAVPLHSNVYRR